MYVIRLKQQTNYNSGVYSELHKRTLRKGGVAECSGRHLPSEHRYSASLVRGLGAVHVALCVLSASMAMVALFGGGNEAEANALASGLGSSMWEQGYSVSWPPL